MPVLSRGRIDDWYESTGGPRRDAGARREPQAVAEMAAAARRFAEYCGVKHARLLVHGTDAIAAALTAAFDLDGWGPSGEIIVPNYTYIATASAPIDRRFTLAFVDIDPVTFTIDPEAVEAAVVPGRTRAILPVHMSGH